MKGWFDQSITRGRSFEHSSSQCTNKCAHVAFWVLSCHCRVMPEEPPQILIAGSGLFLHPSAPTTAPAPLAMCISLPPYSGREEECWVCSSEGSHSVCVSPAPTKYHLRQNTPQELDLE